MVQKAITIAMEITSTVVLVKQTGELADGRYIGERILIVPAIIAVGFISKEINKIIISRRIIRRIIRIIHDTEIMYGIQINEDTAIDVLKISRRKCEMNGKGISYLPTMFADDLKQSVVMKAINTYSAKINC